MCKVFFFLLRSVGRRDLSAGPEQKEKHHPGCFFFCSGPGERQGKEKPRAGTGPEQKKKHHPGCFCFLLRPRGKAREGEAPLGAGTGPEQKKNTTQGVLFFLLQPRGKAGEGEAPLGAGTVVFFFFCSGPVPAPNGASPSPAFPRGRSKKKNTWVVFFFALAPCRRPTELLLPLPFAGAAAKKKTPWVVFFFLLWPRAGTGLLLPLPFPGAGATKKNTLGGVFFLLRPRADAHSLTAGLGGDASPSPGWCLFFCCGAGPDRGGVFFFAVAPPGRSLTHCGLGRFRQGPGGVFFFLLRPRRVFLDNNKKCLGYYIGSKKTRRGHSKKKNTTSVKMMVPFWVPNIVRHLLLREPKKGP